MRTTRSTTVITMAVLAAIGLAAPPARAGGQHEPIIADLNGDGLADRATLGALSKASTNCMITVEQAKPGGGYLAPQRHTYLTLREPGNYCPDLGTAVRVSSTRTDLVVGWFYGRPPGVSSDLLVVRNFRVIGGAAAIFQPSSIGAADFNGDGRQDVYEWTDQGDGFRSYLSSGTATLTPGAVNYCSGLPDPHLADFNRNGATDVVLSYIEGCGTFFTGVAVILDNGRVIDLQGDTAGTHSWTAGVGDFNGDGNSDVVTTDDRGTITHFIGVGDGTFVVSPRPNPDRVTIRRTAVRTTIPVLANDFATSRAVLGIVTPPQHGRAVVSGRQVVYTADPGNALTDRFVYQLIEDGRSRNAAVNIVFSG